MYQNNAAAKANEKLFYERSQYTHTTVPLMKIDDTLKELKNILNEILDVLRNNQQK